jgi:hypothetical protein
MGCHPPNGILQCTQLCECSPVRWMFCGAGSCRMYVGRSGAAADRYIVSQPHVMRTVDIVRALRERFPGIVVPDGCDVPLTINIDSSKVRWNIGHWCR